MGFQFIYFHEPIISVTFISPGNGASFDRQAVIDTGAEVSLFDDSVATGLGLDLSTMPVVNISGVGGRVREARLAEGTLHLLGRPHLNVSVELAFAPDVETLLGNLIGLDILGHFDLALSHAQRLGYLNPMRS